MAYLILPPARRRLALAASLPLAPEYAGGLDWLFQSPLGLQNLGAKRGSWSDAQSQSSNTWSVSPVGRTRNNPPIGGGDDTTGYVSAAVGSNVDAFTLFIYYRVNVVWALRGVLQYASVTNSGSPRLLLQNNGDTRLYWAGSYRITDPIQGGAGSVRCDVITASGRQVKWWCNGRFVGGCFEFASNTASTLWLGNGYQYSAQISIASGGWWEGRALPDYLAALLSADPFAVLQTPKPRLYFDLGAGGGITIAATAGTSSATGIAAGVSQGITVNAAVGTAAASAVAAAVTQAITVNATAGASAASGVSAGIALGGSVLATVGTSAATGVAAAVSLGTTVNAAVGSSAAAGVLAGIGLGITTGVGTSAARGVTAAIEQAHTIAATAGAARATAVTAAISLGGDIGATAGASRATGVTANVSVDHTVAATAGASRAVGVAASVADQIVVPANVGSSVASGVAALVSGSITVAATAGVSTAIGAAASVGFGALISCGIGTARALGVSALVQQGVQIDAAAGSSRAAGITTEVWLSDIRSVGNRRLGDESPVVDPQRRVRAQRQQVPHRKLRPIQ